MNSHNNHNHYGTTDGIEKGEEAENGESAHVKPLSYLDIEERRRRSLCVALVVFATVLASLGAIAVWVAHVRLEERLANRDRDAAAANLATLNQNTKQLAKTTPSGCESTLLIMRHCEKYGQYVFDEDGNEHCSYVGYTRAQYISTLFGDEPEARWPAPAHLFALTPDRGGRWNFREWETLHPLSMKLGINLDVSGRIDLADGYFDLLRAGSLCGSLTVVSWKHEYIPELAIALGCGPDNGCPSVYPEDNFDVVWILTYAFHPPDVAQQDGTEQHDEFKMVETNGTARRYLKHRHHHHHHHHRAKEQVMGWNVYATVSNQGFDPLAFGKRYGDYKSGGKALTEAWWRDEI